MPEPIRHAILRTFPDLAATPFAVAGKGWHSLAVEAGGFLFKVPEGAEAEEALRREARLLAAVRPRLAMAVPDMTLHDGPPLFSRHRKLAGRTLEAGAYAALDAVARDRLAEDLALFFAELHAVPRPVMQAAGAMPAEWWDTAEETLAPVWPHLPGSIRGEARAAVRAYSELPPDPLGEVYGFFDAHGWNMAFDRDARRLAGIFDFADSGFGPPHREFVQVSLIAPDLAARGAAAYERLTGRSLDRRRIFLLAAAQRLSELAGALELRKTEEAEPSGDSGKSGPAPETGDYLNLAKTFVLDWFAQDSVR